MAEAAITVGFALIRSGIVVMLRLSQAGGPLDSGVSILIKRFYMAIGHIGNEISLQKILETVHVGCEATTISV